jgi:hypothetical protein
MIAGRRGRRWLVGAAVATVAVGASCGSRVEPNRDAEAAGVPPTTRPVASGAPARIELLDSAFGVALGGDELLLTSREGDEDSWSILDVGTQERTPVARPSYEDGDLVSLLSFGDRAVAWTVRCPDYSEQDLENSKMTCEDGFDGVEVQLFESARREWVDVGLFTPSEMHIGDPTAMNVSHVGVSRDSLYLRTFSDGRSGVLAIDLPAGTVRFVDVDSPDDVSIHCVTPDGVLVGSVVPEGEDDDVIDLDHHVVPPDRVLAVLPPDARSWTLHEHVPIDGDDWTVGCGAETISIIGTPPDAAATTVWRKVGVDGTVLSDDVLDQLAPPEVSTSDRLFGQGTDGIGFVRDSRPGESTRTGDGLMDFDLEIYHTVVVVPGPDREPVVLHDRDQSEGSVGAVRLASGAIVAFDHTAPAGTVLTIIE